MPISPQDYLMPQQDFSQNFAKGLSLGTQLREIGRKRREEALLQKQLQDQEARKQQYMLDLNSTFENPTPKSMAQLIAKYPQQREAFKQSFDLLSDEQKKNDITITSQVYSALMNNRPEIATNIVNKQIEAQKNAGIDTTKLQNILSFIEKDPKGAAGFAGMTLSSIMPEDQFAKTFKALGSEKRADELQPEEIKKQKAEISKYYSDIGLNKAKEKKALAEINKLSQETQKIILDMQSAKDNNEVFDEKEKFEKEGKLRGEYVKGASEYVATKGAFDKINAAEDNAVGDLSLIFSYMKMLDPGSVVREGEFATAQNATGIDSKVRNIYNNILKGERLSKGQRKSFKGQAKRLLTASKKQENAVRRQLTTVADNYGLNKENIFEMEEATTETAQEDFPSATPSTPINKTISVDEAQNMGITFQ